MLPRGKKEQKIKTDRKETQPISQMVTTHSAEVYEMQVWLGLLTF